MKIQKLLRWYRATLFLTVVAAYAISAAVIISLLLVNPQKVLWLLDTLSPITRVVRDVLWNFFPETQWLQKAGEWMGNGMRWGLKRTTAQQQAVARLVLLDGPVLLTFLAWGVGSVLRLAVTIFVAWRFNTRYEIVRRKAKEESVVRQDPPLAGTPPRPPTAARLPHVLEGPSVNFPPRS
jgi:hypothetical protein